MANGVSNTFRIVCSGVLVASLLTSCTTATTPETESAVPSSSVVESSVSETTTDTSEETEYTGFSVETEPHENPFGEYIYDDGYASIASYSIYAGEYKVPALYYGFDSPYVTEALQSKLYEITGNNDEKLTLSDVNYFQYNDVAMDLYGWDYNFASTMKSDDAVNIEALRAIMSTLGLRFGIDEIPASYLMERFPRFYYDTFQDVSSYIFQTDVPINVVDLNTLDSIKDIPDDNQLDIVLFQTCMFYNMYRIGCMYGHPYGSDYSGFITQARDAETGKNILVPTPEQAALMQEDINSMAGLEDVDIFTPQTPDDFYNAYGYYPDELLEVRDDSVNAPANAQEYIDYFQNFGA